MEDGIKNFGPLRKVEACHLAVLLIPVRRYPSRYRLSPAGHISTRERYNVAIDNA